MMVVSEKIIGCLSLEKKGKSTLSEERSEMLGLRNLKSLKEGHRFQMPYWN